MKTFEFKSQICTSRSQSERLLALGLKKETADMYYDLSTHITEVPYTRDELQRELERNDVIPAWSLHRLLEMLYADTGECMIFFPNTYDEFIADIENYIRRGIFNKNYLEENNESKSY